MLQFLKYFHGISLELFLRFCNEGKGGWKEKEKIIVLVRLNIKNLQIINFCDPENNLITNCDYRWKV